MTWLTYIVSKIRSSSDGEWPVVRQLCFWSFSVNYSIVIIIIFKVEKILKGSLDSTQSPSPSVKIQIMGRKICFRCKGKTFLGVVNKLLYLKQTFWLIIWRWCNGIQYIFSNLFYFLFFFSQTQNWEKKKSYRSKRNSHIKKKNHNKT